MKTLSLHMQTNNGVSTNMDIVYVAPVQNKAGIWWIYQTTNCNVIIIKIVISNNIFLETFCLINWPKGASVLVLYCIDLIDWIWFLMFNATFSSISAISWRPVLVVEEAGENHRPWASNWKALSHATASRVHPFCNLQSRARTHAVLVIGLYELLDNPTT